jgi:hypothetical protein
LRLSGGASVPASLRSANSPDANRLFSSLASPIRPIAQLFASCVFELAGALIGRK